MTEMKTTVNLTWHDGVAGHGTLKANYLETNIAIPENTGGSGNGANPKELLVSAATSCYVATLTYMLETRKLPVRAFDTKTESTVSDAGFKIVHYPTIQLKTDATDKQIEAAKRTLEGADQACEIGNLLKKAGIEIVVEGQVSVE